MKKILAIVCFALLISAGPALADNWVLTPTGTVDVSTLAAGAALNVELGFNYTGGMSAYFQLIDVSFAIDLAEVTPKLNKSGQPDIIWNIGAGFASIASQVVGGQLDIAAGNLGGYNTWATGYNNVATIQLLLVAGGPADGGDLNLLAQSGSKGILDYYGNWASYGGVTGPDYDGGGGPVIPIPGAVYLLFSGLIGLLGLRRRIK